MNHMHPDSLLLVSLIDAHDQTNGNTPDSDGKISGIDSSALTGAAGHRAQQMLDGYGSMIASLDPQQKKDLVMLMAALWKDGFAVGAQSHQRSA
jgi:hypothetical protein